MHGHKSLGKLFILLSLICITSHAELAYNDLNYAVPREPAPNSMVGTPTYGAPTYFYTDLGQVVQIVSHCYYANIPVTSGRLPSGAVYQLQIQNTQYSLDYRGPYGGAFRVSGDVASGRGSVQGTLPSGSSISWAW